MERISWADCVRNEEVLQRVKEERNILHTIKRRKANWIGHILRRNCLLKHVIEVKLEGRIEVKGRRGRRRKQLLDDLKKEKILKIDSTVWRTRFGRGYRPVIPMLHQQYTSFSFERFCVCGDEKDAIKK
jgi:replicative superfamily II helicase